MNFIFLSKSFRRETLLAPRFCLCLQPPGVDFCRGGHGGQSHGSIAALFRATHQVKRLLFTIRRHGPQRLAAVHFGRRTRYIREHDSRQDLNVKNLFHARRELPRRSGPTAAIAWAAQADFQNGRSGFRETHG